MLGGRGRNLKNHNSLIKIMEEPNQKQQEIIYKFSIFEQQMRQIQEQLQAVEQGIIELNELNKGLEELIGKKGSEILSPVGRGIFAKAKLLSEDLIVDIGGKKFVKKTIPKTKEMVDNQIKRLEDVYEQLTKSLDDLNAEVMKLIGEVEGKGN